MVPSPCINVCKMDDSIGLCRGCLRTLDEIVVWGRADDAARLNILAAVAERRQDAPPRDDELRCECER